MINISFGQNNCTRRGRQRVDDTKRVIVDTSHSILPVCVTTNAPKISCLGERKYGSFMWYSVAIVTLRKFQVSKRENMDPLCGIVYLLFSVIGSRKGKRFFLLSVSFYPPKSCPMKLPLFPKCTFTKFLISTPVSPSCSDCATS